MPRPSASARRSSKRSFGRPRRRWLPSVSRCRTLRIHRHPLTWAREGRSRRPGRKPRRPGATAASQLPRWERSRRLGRRPRRPGATAPSQLPRRERARRAAGGRKAAGGRAKVLEGGTSGRVGRLRRHRTSGLSSPGALSPCPGATEGPLQWWSASRPAWSSAAARCACPRSCCRRAPSSAWCSAWSWTRAPGARPSLPVRWPMPLKAGGALSGL
mmetsp:Transcript_118526/g.377796  ORF Transcript_118526/g.377796 Transcript_118526/m.377796 type:complete len:215 (+) Transcript_118526:276-920(+)